MCVAVWCAFFTVSQPAALSGTWRISGPLGLCSSPFKLENGGILELTEWGTRVHTLNVAQCG